MCLTAFVNVPLQMLVLFNQIQALNFLEPLPNVESLDDTLTISEGICMLLSYHFHLYN